MSPENLHRSIDTPWSPRRYVPRRGVLHFDDDLDANPKFVTSRFQGTPVMSLRTLDHRYLKSEDGMDLFEPPGEQRDVATQNPDVSEQLGRALGLELEATTTHVEVADTAACADVIREQLRDPGYL